MSILAHLSLARKDFTLDVRLHLPGTGVCALFGPSGSGKTSILRCLAGLDRAPGGKIDVAGEPWQDAHVFVPPHRRSVGYVFQEASLLPHLTVARNLDYGLQRTAPALRRISLARACDLLGLGHLLARRPHQLSGGERQRAAIARALLTSPKLLLMDEPLSNLDQVGKQEILPYLKRLHGELAIPLIYVSHALDEVLQLADTMVYLQQGRVIASGPLAQLLTRTDLPFAHEADAQSLIDASVAGFDAQFCLNHLDCAFGRLSVLAAPQASASALRIGQQVRLRIQAKDVSIALPQKFDRHHSSILNSFPVTITAIDADRPGQVLLSLSLPASSLPLSPAQPHQPPPTALLARITAKSASTLQLSVGQQVIAQVKSVALVS